MSHHKEHTPQQPDQATRDESGSHKRREAIGEREANTPTRGAPRAETEGGERPIPASQPKDE